MELIICDMARGEFKRKVKLEYTKEEKNFNGRDHLKESAPHLIRHI